MWNPFLDVEGNIFTLVLIGDGNVLSVWLEVMVGDATKLIVLHTEGHVKHTINIENKRGPPTRWGGQGAAYRREG